MKIVESFHNIYNMGNKSMERNFEINLMLNPFIFNDRKDEAINIQVWTQKLP